MLHVKTECCRECKLPQFEEGPSHSLQCSHHNPKTCLACRSLARRGEDVERIYGDQRKER